MKTVGVIQKQIMNDVNEFNAEKFGPMILENITRAYQDVVEEHLWRLTLDVYKPADATFATQPVTLPSNLKRIKSVRDSNYSYYENHDRGHNCIHPYNWYYDTVIQTALQSGRMCNPSNDSTSLTFDFSKDTAVALNASVAGEYIQIGQYEDMYKISTRDSDTQVTLSVPFRGTQEEVRNTPWQIRPLGTSTIHLVDNNGDDITPSTLEIEYQIKPMGLYKATDLILLPDSACQAVYIRALQYAMKRKGWGRAASGEDTNYRHALALAKREEPSRKDSVTPKTMFKRPTEQDMLRSTLQGS